MAYRIKSVRLLLEKARRCRVEDRGNERYRVTSATSGESYEVSLNILRCECARDEWISEENGFVNHCAHVQAALIYRWLKAGYWLVARQDEANVKHLKRMVVRARLEDQEIDDGVKWTARKIREAKAKAKLARMGAQVTHVEKGILKDIAKAAEAQYG